MVLLLSSDGVTAHVDDSIQLVEGSFVELKVVL